MRIHALTKTNKKATKPVRKIVFDIETIQWTNPYALGMYNGQEFTLFKGKNCIKEFLHKYLTDKHRWSIAYAHNGGKFDFNFILKELCTKEYMSKYHISPMRIGSRIVQIEIQDANENTWTLRDSLPLLNFSLKELTNNFNVKHKKGAFDHTKINWNNWEKLQDEWLPYLESDCKGLYEVLEIYEGYLLDQFHINLRRNITTAQKSLSIYRLNFLNTVLPNYQSREEEIRKSYFGGRTEIFRHYGTKLNYYDVNSLYPYVMKKHPMPTGVPIRSYTMKINHFGIAKASIISPEDIDIPLLPYRQKTKTGYKLIFPRGQWTGWYCTPELQKAESLGYQIKIHEGFEFKQEDLFSSYIDTMFHIKEESAKDSVPYIDSKLNMNSLYGKFGQKREKQQITINPKSIIGLEPIDAYGELPFYIKKVVSQSKHILPAITSFITSYSRLHLYKYLEQCDPIYCDTDSIITNKELPTGKKLGELKNEVPEGIEQAYFFLPKMYALRLETPRIIKGVSVRDFIKCKGFPKDSFTFEDFEYAYRTKDMSKFTYEKEKFALPFESMRRNKTFVSMLNVKRSVVTTYDKRTLQESGRTIPLSVKEIMEKFA